MRLRSNSIWSRAIVGVVLAWFVVVIVAYYAVYKPLGFAQINALRDLALILLGWLSAVALANLLGWAVFRKFPNLASAE
ncbi:MAG: hypothetical protein J4N76_08925, partial [Chloroflexi bacterium]|nr:hypothetical protein [Chloroflexota bacterium]